MGSQILITKSSSQLPFLIPTLTLHPAHGLCLYPTELLTLPIISLWKPLRGPLYDWPLALCDASTINPRTDLEPCDQVFANHASENMQVRYREQQRWYYLEGQRDDEVLVFRQSDSREEPACGESSSLLSSTISGLFWMCHFD